MLRALGPGFRGIGYDGAETEVGELVVQLGPEVVQLGCVPAVEDDVERKSCEFVGVVLAYPV